MGTSTGKTQLFTVTIAEVAAGGCCVRVGGCKDRRICEDARVYTGGCEVVRVGEGVSITRNCLVPRPQTPEERVW